MKPGLKKEFFSNDFDYVTKQWLQGGDMMSKNKTKFCRRGSSCLGILFGLGLCFTRIPCAFGEEPKEKSYSELAEADREKGRKQLEKIKNEYINIHKRIDSHADYPSGVTEAVTMAIRMSAFHDGQSIVEFESVFGADALIWPLDSKKALALVPLDYRVNGPEVAPLVKASSYGGQWHLFIYLSPEGTVTDLTLHYGSLKTFMWKGYFEPGRFPKDVSK